MRHNACPEWLFSPDFLCTEALRTAAISMSYLVSSSTCAVSEAGLIPLRKLRLQGPDDSRFAFDISRCHSRFVSWCLHNFIYAYIQPRHQGYPGRVALHKELIAMSRSSSSAKNPTEPALRDSVLDLILKKRCPGGCLRELERESEANKCFGSCDLVFCNECALHKGTLCQECRNFSCYACWDTISNNGCPACDEDPRSDSERDRIVVLKTTPASKLAGKGDSFNFIKKTRDEDLGDDDNFFIDKAELGQRRRSRKVHKHGE